METALCMLPPCCGQRHRRWIVPTPPVSPSIRKAQPTLDSASCQCISGDSSRSSTNVCAALQYGWCCGCGNKQTTAGRIHGRPTFDSCRGLLGPPRAVQPALEEPQRTRWSCKPLVRTTLLLPAVLHSLLLPAVG